MMVLLLPVAIITITKHKLWRSLLNDWVMRLIAAYIVIHILTSLILFQGVLSGAAGLAIDLRYVLFFSLVRVLLRIFPHYKRIMLGVGMAGAFVVVTFATVQLFLPKDILSYIGYNKDTIIPYLLVDQNPEYVRVNSTLRGPNPLGAYAAMTLGLLVAAMLRSKELSLKNRKSSILVSVFVVCSTVALWISYSRSSLVAAMIIIAIVAGAVMARKMSRKILIAAPIIILVVTIGFFTAYRSSGVVSNVLYHQNPDSVTVTNSNSQHAESLETGVGLLIRQPLGAGVGSTGSASLHANTSIIIENQYLFVAHEVGWLGLAIFISLFILILMRLWRQRQDWLALGVFASGIGLALIGLLLPVWVDDTVSIVWWGLAAIALAGGSHGRKQQTK